MSMYNHGIYMYVICTYSGSDRCEVWRYGYPPLEGGGEGVGDDVTDGVELTPTAYVYHVIGTCICICVSMLCIYSYLHVIDTLI
jgi:hypothetical protein